MRIKSEQAKQWVLDIRKNIKSIRFKRKLTQEQMLSFASSQYETLYQLSRAIDGRVWFVGVPQPITTEIQNG